MAKFFWHLVGRSLSPAFSSAGTTVLGFIGFGIVSVILGHFIFRLIQLLRRHSGKPSRQQKKDYDGTVATIVASFLVMMIFLGCSVVATVFRDYTSGSGRPISAEPTQAEPASPAHTDMQAQGRFADPVKSKMKSETPAGETAKAHLPTTVDSPPSAAAKSPSGSLQQDNRPQPNQPQPIQPSPSQSQPNPEEQAYPNLEAAAGQLHVLALRWSDDSSRVRTIAMSPTPVGHPSPMGPNNQIRDEQWQEYRTRVDQGNKAALERAEQELVFADRNASIEYSNVKPSILASRDAAFGCMNLTQQDRSIELDNFRRADAIAGRSLLLKELGPAVQDEALRQRFVVMENYLNTLLARLAKFHCGVSRKPT